MKKANLTKAAIATGAAAGALLFAALPATASDSVTQTTSTVSQSSVVEKQAQLRFTGGYLNFEDPSSDAAGDFIDPVWTVVAKDGGVVAGTSKGAGQFTQDDGWNQEYQEWTGGNELTFTVPGAFGDDAEFQIANLTFGGGRATGMINGPHPDITGMDDLYQVNLAGNRKFGTPAATVEVKGDDVVLTAHTNRGGRIILHFQLTVRG